MIVVLPQKGLDRCRNKEDWVRKEIAHAIKSKKNIIPVMMRNFEFPIELPEDIEELKNFNGISANMEYFDAAFTKLLSMIKASKHSNIDRINQLTNDEEMRTELIDCIEKLESENTAENKIALAKCYSKLNNESLNEEIAQIYLQAAELGNAIAQNELGNCYYNGKGVEKNIERAFEWYRIAAEQGLSEAQYNLARCFEKHHKKLSFIWMKKASEQSHITALYKMGEYYEYGTGVEIDIDISKQYYNRASEMGHSIAQKKTNNKYWRSKAIKNFFYGISH